MISTYLMPRLRFTGLIVLLLLSSGCDKDDNALSVNGDVPTGEYLGTLFNGLTTQTNFAIDLSKAGGNKYIVKEKTAGGVPTFYIELKLTDPAPLVQFDIPPQKSADFDIVGPGYEAGSGYDAIYNGGQKQFSFYLKINGSTLVTFNGIKH